MPGTGERPPGTRQYVSQVVHSSPENSKLTVKGANNLGWQVKGEASSHNLVFKFGFAPAYFFFLLHQDHPNVCPVFLFAYVSV